VDIGRLKTAILAIIPFLLAMAVWWVHPHIAFDTDSSRYLSASAMRTATYPLFLRAANGPALLPIQLLLFAAALSWLAVYSSRLLPSIVAAALVVAIAANPFIWQLQGTVMSEALTTPVLVLLVGCILGIALTGRRSLAIIAGLLCGIATTARPSLLPLVLSPLSAVWLAGNAPDRVRLSALVLLVFAAPISAERVYSYIAHGPELTSPMGRQLFMKAAVIDAPPTPAVSNSPLDRALARELNQDYAPVRQLLARTADPDIRAILAVDYEGCAGWGCFVGEWNSFGVSEAELHRHLFQIGLARLASNPVGYLKLTASEYPRMWLLHPRKHPGIAPKYNAFLTRESPIPFQAQMGEEGRPTPAAEQKPILRVNRLAFAAVGLVAFMMTLGLAVWRPRRLSDAAFSLLLGSQAVLLFSAFLGSGQVRYAMDMWPTLVAAELLGIVAVLEFSKSKLGTGLRK
jgi:hypothetical protein